MKKINCKCGCGKTRPQFDNRGRERFFIAGHQGKFARQQMKKDVWNKGKKNVYSKETLQKMRERKLGIKLSEEHKKKIGIGNLKNDVKTNYKRKQARWLAKDHIKKNKNCDICGSINNLQRHHWNYNKPLLINTLCSTCHKIQHIKHFTGGI